MFKILRLEAENFVLFEDLSIDFNKLQSNLIFINGRNLDVAGAGANGAGKTLIGDLISDLLFDRTIRRHSPASLIGPFGKWSCGSISIVDTVFETVYSLYKYRNHPALKDSVKFEMMKVGQPIVSLGKKTKADTYKEIWKTFGISWEVFKNKNYFAQDDDGRFLNVSDQKKAEVIIQSQNLKDLQVAKKLANDSSKKRKKESGEIKIGIAKEEEFIEDLKSMHKEMKEKAQASLDKEKEQIKRITASIEFLMKKSKKLKFSKSRFKELKTKVEMFERDKDQVDKLKSEMELTEKDLRLTLSNLSSENEKLNDLDEKISEAILELKESKNRVITRCLKCGQKLTDMSYEKIIKNLKKTIRTKKKRREEIGKNIDNIREVISDYEFKISELESEINSYREPLMEGHKIQKEFDELVRIKEEAEKIEKEIISYENVIKSCEAKIEAIEDTGSSDKVMLQIEEVREEINKSNEKKSKLDSLIDKDEFSKSVFEKTMRLMFERFLVNLNHYSNKFLEILSDNDIEVEFQPKTKQKSKKIVDKINVLVSVAGSKPRNFRTYSGGEKKRIELSTQLALFSADETTFPFLFLDEPFHGVHKEGRERILLLLEEKANEGNIVFVTNSEDISYASGANITVERISNRSIIKDA